jgi:hypothetical protein
MDGCRDGGSEPDWPGEVLRCGLRRVMVQPEPRGQQHRNQQQNQANGSP